LLCKKVPGFGWYYQKIRNRKGSGAAAVATARKLLAVIWRMLKDNRLMRLFLPVSWKFRILTVKLSFTKERIS